MKKSTLKNFKAIGLAILFMAAWYFLGEIMENASYNLQFAISLFILIVLIAVFLLMQIWK